MTLCPVDKLCCTWPSKGRTARAHSSFLNTRQTLMLGNDTEMCNFNVFQQITKYFSFSFRLFLLQLFSLWVPQLPGPRRDKQHCSWPSVTSCLWWWTPFAQEELTCRWLMTKVTLHCGWLLRTDLKISRPHW